MQTVYGIEVHKVILASRRCEGVFIERIGRSIVTDGVVDIHGIQLCGYRLQVKDGCLAQIEGIRGVAAGAAAAGSEVGDSIVAVGIAASPS